MSEPKLYLQGVDKNGVTTSDEWPAADEKQKGSRIKVIEDSFLARLRADVDIASTEATKITVDDARALLDTARKRADGWRTGAAASTALVFATLSVKDEGIAKFSNVPQLLLILITLATVTASLLSLYRMLRAANGPSWLDSRFRGRDKPYDAERYLRRVAGVAHDLKWGQRFWLSSVVGFIALVILSWTLPLSGEWSPPAKWFAE